MNILYADYLSPQGHYNFNTIQLKNICKLGNNVDLIFRTGYLSELDIDRTEYRYLYELPEYLFILKKNKILLLFQLIKRLYYIKRIVKKRRYDYIIFSSYIAVPHLFIRYKPVSYLVNHYNTCFLNNRKICVMRILQHNYRFVVFNEYIQKYLTSIKIKSEIVRHGYHPTLFRDIEIDRCNDKYLFIPTTSMVDKKFVCKLLKNEHFLDFLKKNDISMFIRGEFICNNNKIKILSHRLTDKEYKSIFMNATIIMLPYSNDFKYRVSGVLFEAFAANVPLLLSNIDSFKAYNQYFTYNPFFNTSDIYDLESKMTNIINVHNKKYYQNLCLEIANWESLLLREATK